MLVAMMYHYVHSENDNVIFSGLPGITIDEFKKQLDFLCEHFTPISHIDLINHFTFGAELPDNAFILTFDDGFKQHYTNVFPILKSYGLKADFYIPSMPLADKKIHLLEKQRLCQYSIFDHYHDFLEAFYIAGKTSLPTVKKLALEPSISNIWKTRNYLSRYRFYSNEERFFRYIRDTLLSPEEVNVLIETLFNEHFSEAKLVEDYYLSYEEILELSLNSMCIGGHTYSHPHLENLSTKESISEIQLGLNHLENLIGDKIDSFSYPFGTYNKNTIQQLKSMNIAYSFTTKNSINSNIESRFELNRIDSSNFSIVLDHIRNLKNIRKCNTNKKFRAEKKIVKIRTQERLC